MRLLAVAVTAVLILVTVAGIVGGFTLLARRLLGLRFGLVRLLLAGLAGFVVAGPIAQSLAGAVPAGEGAATPVWFLVLAGACALVVAMVFLVVAEALVPSGSVPGPASRCACSPTSATAATSPGFSTRSCLPSWPPPPASWPCSSSAPPAARG
jgi:hypothetical protein